LLFVLFAPFCGHINLQFPDKNGIYAALQPARLGGVSANERKDAHEKENFNTFNFACGRLVNGELWSFKIYSGRISIHRGLRRVFFWGSV